MNIDNLFVQINNSINQNTVQLTLINLELKKIYQGHFLDDNFLNYTISFIQSCKKSHIYIYQQKIDSQILTLLEKLDKDKSQTINHQKAIDKESLTHKNDIQISENDMKNLSQDHSQLIPLDSALEYNKFQLDGLILKLEYHNYISNLRVSNNAMKSMNIYDPNSDFSLQQIIKSHLKSKLGVKQLHFQMMNVNTDPEIVKLKNQMFRIINSNNRLLEFIVDFVKNSNDLSKLQVRFKNKKVNSSQDDIIMLQINLENLANFLLNLNSIKEIISQSELMNEYYAEIKELSHKFTPCIQFIRDIIDVNYQKSNKEIRLNSSSDHLSSELTIRIDEIQTKVESIKKLIENKANCKLKTQSFKNINYTFQIAKNKYEEIKKLTQVIELSLNKAHVKFTTKELSDLSQEYTQLQKEIDICKSKYSNDLLNIVSKFSDPIEELMDLLGILDITQAMHMMVKKSNGEWTIPEFNEHKSLHVEGLYNVLLTKTKDSDSIITNSVSLNYDDNLLISGPNMGGKTTILRALGLVQYLSMLGCAVPASSCSIHFIDSIAVRIGAEDDCSLGLSTFMNEMVEIEQCLSQSTCNSVVILDEFGRGTSTSEGMGLLLAILEDLSLKHVKSFCATHFHEVVPQGIQLKYKSMQMAVLEEGEQIILTQKLIEGKSDKSQGVNVLKILKYPDQIVNDAEMELSRLEIKSSMNNNINLVY